MTSPVQVLEIHITVTGAQEAAAATQQAASGFDKFKKGVAKANKAANYAGAAVLGLAAAAGKAASDVEQSYGGLESVFGDQADMVKKWADDGANSVGLAKNEYAEAAAQMGAALKNMGLDTQASAKQTQQMISLGADLSAAFGGDASEAVAALGSALRGESEPAKRYALDLSKTAVAAELAARGQDKLQGEALKAAQAQAIMDLATKQAGGAVGQFAREADTAAGAQQRANAQWSNAQAELGKALLPIMQRAGQIIAAVSQWVQENADTVRQWGVIILGAAAAIKVLNFALNASPLKLIITGIAAIAAGLTVLWQKSETFRNIVTGVWEAVKSAAEVAWRIIRTIIETVVRIVTGVVENFGRLVAGVWAAIRGAAEIAWNIISGIVQGVAKAIGGFIQGAATVIGGIWHGIKATAEAIWSGIGAVIGAVVDTVKAVWGGITSFFSNLWNIIKITADAIWSGISNVITTVVGWVKDAWNGIVSFFTGLWESVKDGVAAAWGWIEDTISGIINRLKVGWDDFGAALPQALADLGAIDQKAVNSMQSVQALQNAISVAQSAARAISGIVGSKLTGSGWLTASAPGGGASGPIYYPDANITINVTSAGDPDATARSIEAALTARARRVGGLTL